jgi:hypothetical protein
VELTGDADIGAIAERNYGVFNAEHLDELGVTKDERKHRLATGRWDAVHDSVYRIVGTPLQWHGRLLAATWAGGREARASHGSAGEVWEMPGRSIAAIEITCRRWKRTRQAGLVVHESRMLTELDGTVRNGIPVTTASRTIFDLAGTVGRRTLDLAIENALRRQLTTLDELADVLDRLGRRGRSGTTALRGALDRRAADDAFTESEAEQLIRRLLTEHGLPEPVPQHEVRDRGGRLVARVDLAYPELKIAIEYDSYEHHVGRDALVRDSARRNAVVALGWLPITATANDLRNGGHRLAIDVQRARSLRSGVS